ncbi:hypothetical protein ASE86_13065 [Sphingomonas sp. Leaf33]|uniref:hypothetical protein n=1 Tax=Sphingomonas sp. Leaf33 TaxID=1736215 RepID=UPI0006FD8DAB|nr:hypothetical protein [Sphingomonas sp. Leaf33]KQN19408.1 hypothetical protein ASE86_13065 [Sphingomonas sp. Leaf33]
MTTDLAAPLPAAGTSPVVDPAPPLKTRWSGWVAAIGPILSLAVLAAALYQLRALDVATLWRMLPTNAGFWLAFAICYAISPISEWIIFRKLWTLPPGGIVPLFRKLVCNELLLGYLGEMYFYSWARRHARITTAPFGAIKDVSILSAIAGNVFTLLLVIVAAPLFARLHVGMQASHFVISVVVILVSSLVIFAFRGRLFSLPRRDLAFVAGIHTVRIIVAIGLSAYLWHEIVPAVALSWWLLLGTLRQILSRLPLMPNKDVVFAGVVTAMIGAHGPIVDAIALLAALSLATHLVVGAVLGASDVVRTVVD